METTLPNQPVIFPRTTPGFLDSFFLLVLEPPNAPKPQEQKRPPRRLSERAAVSLLVSRSCQLNLFSRTVLLGEGGGGTFTEAAVSPTDHERAPVVLFPQHSRGGHVRNVDALRTFQVTGGLQATLSL